MKPQKSFPGCTVACKLMPLYRAGVFQELSSMEEVKFTFLGDTKVQGGIKTIDWSGTNKEVGGIRWIRTRNFFYKPELLLWQTGVLKRIFFSRDKVFIFEGALSHLPNWIFPVFCKLMGKKVLFWTHGFRGNDKGLKKNIRKFFFKRFANGLLLYGERSKQLMLDAGFSEKTLFVVYNSLYTPEQPEFTSLKKDRRLEGIFTEPDLFTIIFIGRLVHSKGVMNLLKTISTLRNEEVFVNAIIIGSGPEQDLLQNFCMENGMQKNVHFTGALYEESAISKYFYNSDLMVSPGNVGLNCLHSFAYGVPVATHNDMPFQGPEAEAIVAGVNGFFFDRKDANDLKNKLHSWIVLPRDKNEITIACRKTIIERYNPKNQANLIFNAVKKMI